MAAVALLSLALLAGVAYGERVSGGSDATIDRLPSLVQVESQGVYSGIWAQTCAGSILTSIHILTVATCFHGSLYAPQYRRIRAGATYRSSGGQVVGVQIAYNHPSYGPNGHDGDISVVRLMEPLIFSNVVQQGVIVDTGFAMPDNIPVSHAGWGATELGGLPSEQLQIATLYTMNNEECADIYGSLSIPMHVSENMLCAALPAIGGAGGCAGDEGGPIYYGDIVISLYSWGLGCGDDYPTVSTAISPYTQWIIETAL